MNPIAPEFFLVVPAIAAAAAGASIVYRRLVRTYPALVSYLILEIVQNLTLLTASHSPRRYFWMWSTFQALGGVIMMLVARELLGLLWSPRPGIATLVRRFYIGALLAAVTVAIYVVWVAYDPQHSLPRHSVYYFQSRTLLYLKMSLTVVLIGTTLFLSFAGLFLLWFAVPMQKMIASHFFIFLAYTFAGIVALLLHNASLASMSAELLNQLLLLASTVGACVSWALLLRRAKAPLLFRMRHPGPAREEQLSQQLDRINNLALQTLRQTAYGNPRN